MTIARTGTRRFALLAPLAIAALCATPGTGSAQDPPSPGHRVAVGREKPAGVAKVSPRTGPVGTRVAVKTSSLPADTRVQVMVGGLRSGFEVIALTMTDANGRLAGSDSIQIVVPEWVTPDRSWLVIITDRMYNPVAVADVFHVTDAGGLVMRSGKISDEESACPVLENDGGEIYFLTGDTGALTPGEVVSAQGRIVDSERCGTGLTLEVVNLRRGAAASR